MITLAIIASVLLIIVSAASIRHSFKAYAPPSINRYDARSAESRKRYARARRFTLAAVALTVLSVGILAGAGASAVTGFFAWTGTGNGRGGQVAAKPACTNDFRGRTWALYGASSAASDALQVCLYTSNGGNVWVAVPR